MKYNKILNGEKIKLRLIKVEEKEEYYKVGFTEQDEEATYLTGSKDYYPQDLVYSYIDRIVNDETRYDFLIIDKNEKIIGEVVLNEIDFENKYCGYRIAIFQKDNFNKGYGSDATKLVIDFAFNTLKLHRIELDVYPFNPRAIAMYKKVGFIQEGLFREAKIINGKYVDVIKMAILDSDYNK